MSVIITALTSRRWEFAVTNCTLYWYNAAMEITTYCTSKYSFLRVTLARVESKEELHIQWLIKNSFLVSFSFIFIFIFMSNFKLLIKYLSFNNIRYSSIVLLLQIKFSFVTNPLITLLCTQKQWRRKSESIIKFDHHILWI